MKPEAKAHLDKARHCLVKARAGLAAAEWEPALLEDAARNTYYVALHAAQALIFERTGKSSKTHAGVHRQFHRLTHDEASMPGPLRSFIISAYDFKATADYETTGRVGVSSARAATAVAMAEQFLSAVVELLADE